MHIVMTIYVERRDEMKCHRLGKHSVKTMIVFAYIVASESYKWTCLVLSVLSNVVFQLP